MTVKKAMADDDDDMELVEGPSKASPSKKASPKPTGRERVEERLNWVVDALGDLTTVIRRLAANCYDRFSSPVGRQNRGGSEVGGILTAVHREFGGCAHRCAGKPKRRDQDRASPRRRGRARSGTAEG